MRVVAPTSVNGGSSSVTTRAPAPCPTVIGSRWSSIAGERLLQRAREAVDLIDEEHAPRLQRGQERRDVPLALERGSGGLHERHFHSAATICASEVFPSPGGPASSR